MVERGWFERGSLVVPVLLLPIIAFPARRRTQTFVRENLGEAGLTPSPVYAQASHFLAGFFRFTLVSHLYHPSERLWKGGERKWRKTGSRTAMECLEFGSFQEGKR